MTTGKDKAQCPHLAIRVAGEIYPGDGLANGRTWAQNVAVRAEVEHRVSGPGVLGDGSMHGGLEARYPRDRSRLRKVVVGVRVRGWRGGSRDGVRRHLTAPANASPLANTAVQRATATAEWMVSAPHSRVASPSR